MLIRTVRIQNKHDYRRQRWQQRQPTECGGLLNVIILGCFFRSSKWMRSWNSIQLSYFQDSFLVAILNEKMIKPGFFAKCKFRIRKLECLECATIHSFCRGLRIYFKPDVHNFSRFEWISKWAKRKWSFLRISFKESLCCRQKTLWKQSDYFAEMRQHGMKFRNNMRRESNPILYNVHHHVSTHSCIVFLSQFLGDH